MFLSEEQANKRLNSPENLINQNIYPSEGDVVIKPVHNAVKKDPEAERTHRHIPDFVRGLVGVAAQHDTLQHVSDTFDVPISTAHAARRGERGVSYQARKDKALQQQIEASLDNAKDLAIARLLQSLNLLDTTLTQEAEEGKIKARELSGIASEMSKVVEKVSLKQNGVQNNTQIIVYAPQIKPIEEYEVIEVNH